MNTLVDRRELFCKLGQVMLKMDDLEKFLNALMWMVVETFGLRWASLAHLDESCGQYIPRVCCQKKQDSEEQILIPSIDEAVSWLKDRQKVVRQRLLEELGMQAAPELIAQLNRSDTFVSMPLFTGESLFGVLNLGAKVNHQDFSPEELELVAELAEIIAPLVKQAICYHAVAEQRLHHQHILDNLVSGIIAIDPEDKITVFNRTAERILNFRAEQLLGKDVRILQENLANLLLDTLHRGKSYRREELSVLPENILIGVSTCQFYDAQGKLLGACMVFSSLEEIKRKEQEARQKELDDYWSNVANSLAHEVKNSILATKVFAEMFPQKYEDAEFRWSLYAALKRDMQKLDDFSEKVLNFARPQQLAMQACQIDKVMDVAISSALQNRDIGGISFEKRYSHNLAPLKGDYHQLKEAFTQLICNALEAMDKTGTLRISIEQERSPQMLIYSLPQVINELPAGSIIVVKIADTGCGILPQDMLHLFNPFFTTKETRTGLGLAAVRKIIERHGGVIRVQSKRGEGSTFWVVLPLSVGVTE